MKVELATYSVSPVTGLSEFDELRTSWKELVERNPSSTIFATWPWIRTWWKFFSQGASLFIITVHERNGSLVGIAPLMRQCMGKIKILKFIGTPHSDYNEFILDPIHQIPAFNAIISFLQGRSEAWDVLELREMSSDSPSWSLLKGERLDEFYQFTLRSIDCPYIELPPNWDTYSWGLSKRRRHYIRNKIAKLQRIGATFRLIEDEHNVAQGMQRLYTLHRQRWSQNNRIDSIHSDRTFYNFLIDIALEFSREGYLWLVELLVEGNPVAIALNFQHKRKIYNYLRGFETKWCDYSPGIMLDALAIRHAIKSSSREYDFTRGDEPYKKSLSNRKRTNKNILLISHGKRNWSPFVYARLYIIFEHLYHRRVTGRVLKILTKCFKPNLW